MGPKFGFWSIMVFQVLDWYFNCLSYPLVCGDMLQNLLKDRIFLGENGFTGEGISVQACIFIAGAPFLVFACLKNLKHVTILCVINFLLTMVFLGAVVFYCVAKKDEWDVGRLEWGFEPRSFSLSLGIVVFSFTTHMFYPILESNMEVKEHFNRMLVSTHALSIIAKLLLSFIAFIAFGALTEEVVSDNIETYWLKMCVNVLLGIKAILTYALPYFAIIQMAEKHMFGMGLIFPPCHTRAQVRGQINKF